MASVIPITINHPAASAPRGRRIPRSLSMPEAMAEQYPRKTGRGILKISLSRIHFGIDRHF
jgi:hypothetical protein